MEILQICGKGFLSISQGVRGVYRNFLLNDESTYFWVSGDGWGYSSNWCRGAYCQHTSPDIEKYYEMCKSRRNSDQCYLLQITNKIIGTLMIIRNFKTIFYWIMLLIHQQILRLSTR
jgi:hypothetical protein